MFFHLAAAMAHGPIHQPFHPFYLHPGDNPSLTFISQVLNEANYASWSINMRRVILSKNKIKFIDEESRNPKE
ncbi:hypothetical protein VIGAN_10087900, partial [Vigna angularis var. angularis]